MTVPITNKKNPKYWEIESFSPKNIYEKKAEKKGVNERIGIDKLKSPFLIAFKNNIDENKFKNMRIISVDISTFSKLFSLSDNFKNKKIIDWKRTKNKIKDISFIFFNVSFLETSKKDQNNAAVKHRKIPIKYQIIYEKKNNCMYYIILIE